jgi:hypothetical protein
VSFNPFSSLSSFQGTNCANCSVQPPDCKATDYHSTHMAKKVKTLRFSRRAWPSLFKPLRCEQLDDTQDGMSVKSSNEDSVRPTPCEPATEVAMTSAPLAARRVLSLRTDLAATRVSQSPADNTARRSRPSMGARFLLPARPTCQIKRDFRSRRRSWSLAMADY